MKYAKGCAYNKSLKHLIYKCLEVLGRTMVKKLVQYVHYI